MVCGPKIASHHSKLRQNISKIAICWLNARIHGQTIDEQTDRQTSLAYADRIRNYFWMQIKDWWILSPFGTNLIHPIEGIINMEGMLITQGGFHLICWIFLRLYKPYDASVIAKNKLDRFDGFAFTIGRLCGSSTNFNWSSLATLMLAVGSYSIWKMGQYNIKLSTNNILNKTLFIILWK